MELGFIHFDQKALNRANKVLKLLQNGESVDELGLGRIRDIFSDLMFPGISVQQTHAKYFLLLPALYDFLEKTRISDFRDARSKVKEYEVKLTRRLDECECSGDKRGIIGAKSLDKRGDYVKYDPARIYQSGLEAYGLVPSGGNIYRMIAERSASRQDHPKKQNGNEDTGDDADDLTGYKPHFLTSGEYYNFNSTNPIDIKLSKCEAELLRNQILKKKGDSLLGYILKNEEYSLADKSFENLAEQLTDTAWAKVSRLALRYSRFYQLLRTRYAFLYNKAIGANNDKIEWEDKFHSYASDLRGIYASDLTPAAIDEMLSFVEEKGINDNGCVSFCKEAAKKFHCDDIDGLDKLIEQREKDMKNVRSKLQNGKKGDPFKGSVTIDFRWCRARYIIKEIKGGLNG